MPHVAALRKDPVVAFLPDLFTRPAPLRPDVIIDVSEQMDSMTGMLACHRSQLFEWLAYAIGVLETVPDDETEKLAWVRAFLERPVRLRAERYREELTARYGVEKGSATEFIEVFEISEYAWQPDAERIAHLFPTGVVPADSSSR